ncbi:MAG TPA: iron-containing alcohol dehydrogenase, partial [Candidatus Ozemobacteraceae bacterium]|nr:iron-containing alcohol dehydrogenase [Candidatus Ozemobacteraceae bacterium]
AMDAFTQLLEAYVSQRASPITDALAWSGMQAFCRGFTEVWRDGSVATNGWSELAYAALCSGICLAQAGLGAVHGLAAGLGSRFDIPHGAACGTLLAAVTAANLRRARATAETGTLAKYAEVGRLVSQQSELDEVTAGDLLVKTVSDWVSRYELPLLATFGVTEADLDDLIGRSRGSSMKTNPVVLSDGELRLILQSRLGQSDALESGPT